MSNEKTLRAKAREALRIGRLPNSRPERIWGGPGVGARCAVCDEPVERNQAEFELQFADRGTEEPALGFDASYHVHVPCFAAWDSERQNGRALPEGGEIGKINLDERDTANGARQG